MGQSVSPKHHRSVCFFSRCPLLQPSTNLSHHVTTRLELWYVRSPSIPRPINQRRLLIFYTPQPDSYDDVTDYTPPQTFQSPQNQHQLGYGASARPSTWSPPRCAPPGTLAWAGVGGLTACRMVPVVHIRSRAVQRRCHGRIYRAGVIITLSAAGACAPGIVRRGRAAHIEQRGRRRARWQAWWRVGWWALGVCIAIDNFVFPTLSSPQGRRPIVSFYLILG
jgi:hypothetical protein